MSLLDEVEKKIAEKNRPKTLLELVEEKLAQSKALTKSLTLLDQVEASRSKLCIKENVFKEYYTLHRDHQKRAIETTATNNRGQIIIPTGTGKTRIQVHTHIADMLNKIKQNESGVYVIGAHRLLLCKQLMDELQDLCLRIGIPINALYVGSARHDEKDVYDQYFQKGIDSNNYESKYTTVGEDVKSFYEKTKGQKRNLIVVSTYHSFDKLKNIEEIDLCTYDEAHTTTEDRFLDNILLVMPKIKRNYFFTATRKVSGDEGGMNDQEIYGDILIAISPTEAIEAGEITMPRIHTINLQNGKTGEVSHRNEEMLIKTVQEAFIQHKNLLKKDSAYPDEIGAKLLVSLKGSNEMELLQNNLKFQEWCSSNSIKTYSYSSRFGNFEDFTAQPNRNKVYENMKSLSDTEDAILLHIDILTEGIDLPSITGVLLLRHLNEIKLFQALGRALRLFKADRKRLYDRSIKPIDRNLFVKPFAYLILPMHFEEMDESSEEMMATLQRVVGAYGIPTEEFLPPEEFDGVSYDYLDLVTNRDTFKKLEKLYPLKHAVVNIFFSKLNKTLPTNPIQKYHVLIELLKELERMP